MSGRGSIIVDSEIGAIKADEVRNKEAAAGSFTGDISVTKAEPGNKETAGKGVVTEKDWLESIFLTTPPAGIEGKAESKGAMITKEMMSVSFIDKLKSRRVFKRLPPINNTTGLYDRFPKSRDINLAARARWNYLVDLHLDVLEQYEKQCFAEVGVDFTDGVKKMFILPKDPGCAP